MITARIDASSSMMLRDHVRVAAWYEDGRERVILGRSETGEEIQFRAGSPEMELPEGVSLYVLDTRRDVARAVYLALKDEFEPNDPAPLASDRAYGDARTDIDRNHALINKLVDAMVLPPATATVGPASERRP